MSRNSEQNETKTVTRGDFLALPQILTMAVTETAHKYEVEAVPLSRPSSCPHCGCSPEQLVLCGNRQMIVDDAPVRGRSVRISFTRQRYKCGNCRRISQQPLEGINSRRRATTRLIDYIAVEAFRKPFQMVSEETGKSAATVRSIFTDRAVQLEQTIIFDTPQCLGLDEVYISGRIHFVLTDLVNRRPIDLLLKADSMTLGRCLLQLPQREQVRVVVMDFNRSNLEIVKRVLPQAAVVINKWNVLRLLQQALLKVWRKVRYSSPCAQRISPPLCSSPLLLKSINRLSIEERQSLETLFTQHPELETAYRLKREFFNIWNFRSKQKAQQQHARWVATVPAEIAYAFGDFLRIIEMWYQEIFNYFDYRLTNAYTESVNYKIDTLARLGNGYAFETIRAKLLYTHIVKGRTIPSIKQMKVRVGNSNEAKKRERARRAPAPRSSHSNTERLRKARESKNKLSKYQQLPAGWVERFPSSSLKNKKEP